MGKGKDPDPDPYLYLYLYLLLDDCGEGENPRVRVTADTAVTAPPHPVPGGQKTWGSGSTTLITSII